MSYTPPLIVPIGGNCFPRWCATLLEFKQRKEAGELSFPLDAGIFPLDMIRHFAETDFSGMTDPANLFVRTASNGMGVLSDRRFPLCSYNHEMPPSADLDYTADDFAPFVARYRRRINNLHGALTAAKRAVLFLSVSNLCVPEEPPFSRDDLEAILSAFERRYPACDFRMLAVVERFQTAVPDSWDGRLRVFNFQMPGPYTRYIFPLISAIATGNILGSVVTSFPGAPTPATRLPNVEALLRVTRNAMEAQMMSALLDTPLPALMVQEGPIGSITRGLVQMFSRPAATPA